MIPYGDVSLNAMCGRTSPAEVHFKKVLNDIVARSEGAGLNVIGWFHALMFNSLGRYDEALEAARTGVGVALGARTAEVGAGRTCRGT